jgi:hypothetical protein
MERTPRSQMPRDNSFDITLAMLLHEGDQVALLLRGKLESQHKTEELDGVFQRQAPAVMEIRRAVFNSTQGKDSTFAAT